MKIYVLILLLLASSFFIYVKPDPAKKIILSYNHGLLYIEVIHPVKNVNSHFIDMIKIMVDGKEVKKIKLTKQSSPEAEIQELVITEIKPGCTVEVKTHCNEFGNKSAKLKL